MRRLCFRVCPTCGDPEALECNLDQLCDDPQHDLSDAEDPRDVYVRLEDAVAMFDQAGLPAAAHMLEARGRPPA